MMKQIFVIISFLFLALTEAKAQQLELFGVVKDADSQEHLVGAAVYIDSLQVGTTTDENGYYELRIGAGRHKIRFSYLGYHTIESTIVIEKSRKRHNVDLKMESQLLEDVIVTSERRDANVRELAMSVQKLEMVKIKKMPALMGEVDVIKAIQLLPGVQASSEGSSGFSVRGGSPDQNLITLDDAPVYNASHFLGFLSVFNNDAVKDATLYKADIPANYDSRLSSVLDVKTLDETPDRFTMTGGIGILTSRLMLNMPFNKQRTSVMLAGRITYGPILASYMIKKLAKTKLYFYDINGKITHALNKNNRISISMYDGCDRVSIDDMMGLGYGNTTANLRWNHIFNDRLTSNLSIMHSKYRYDIDVMSDPYDFTVTAGLTDYSLKYDFVWMANGKTTVKYGLSTTYHQYLLGELDDRTGVVATYIEADDDERLNRKALESALYFTNEHKITPLFSLRYGLRLSMFNNIGAETLYLFDEEYRWVDSAVYGGGDIFHTETHLEPRLAMIYQVGATSSVKASYARTVQYAQLGSNSTGGLPFDMWFPTSPNIKPQKCDQLAAGYFRNFRGNDIETSVELFYKRLTDVIDFADDAFLIANALIDGEVRVGKGRSYGAEFIVRKNYGKLTGWVAYTYSRAFRTVKGISHDEEYQSPYDRPHNISVVANYAFSDRFDVSATWVYNTGQPVTLPYGKYTVDGVTYSIYNGYRNKSRYPDYHRLDLSANLKCRPHRRWQGEWSFSIYNAYARHNTWAIMFKSEDDGTITTKKVYLFSVVPSVSYNFKF